ncbi:MAG TPA: RagB/SusD family nutrient uptake outer membrane protein [Mucilaginibacter sp.]|jgi:hypothetical protein|nr:RagB/SusD family nutrient uptake outer membrane protein [Mucilaginibacter sp.]
MKKSYGKFIALAFLAVFTLTYSCKKLLNQEVTGKLSGAVLANKAGLDGLLIGAYSALKGYDETSTEWETGIDNWIYGGVGADDAFKGSNTTDQPTAAPIENHSLDPSNEYISEKWAFFYNAVQRANDVIREVPLIKDGSVSPAYGAEAILEARFLRGVFHFELCKMFKNVPYVDETVTYAAGNYNVPNPGPIWKQIEADFAAGASTTSGLPVTQSDVGRANMYAAEAMLARAYLFDHQYATALPLFTDCILNGKTAGGTKYALAANYEDNYDASKKNGPESVFAVQMTVNDGSNGNNDNPGEALNFPAGDYTSCCGFYQPSYTLANAFKVDENGLPMLGTTSTSVTDYTGDNKTTTTVTANIPNYALTYMENDHNCSNAKSVKWNPTGAYTKFALDPTSPTPDTIASAPYVQATDALDPRIDWTLGRYGIPYRDWGLCGGEQWSRGDLCPYNPIKNVFNHAQQSSTTDNNGGWATAQGTSDNYNIMTVADLYLYRAECEIETGVLATAMADINVVRARMQNTAGWVHTYVDNSNPSAGFTNTPAANYQIGLYTSFPSQAYAREAVQMEEQLEFGMEGHRFFDLQRWDGVDSGPMGTGFMAGVVNGHIANVTRKFDILHYYINPVMDGHTFTAGRNELYPVPLEQIQLENGQLKQNPGY